MKYCINVMKCGNAAAPKSDYCTECLKAPEKPVYIDKHAENERTWQHKHGKQVTK